MKTVAQILGSGSTGIAVPIFTECPKCQQSVCIPAGQQLRIPNEPKGRWCHELINMVTGQVFSRGGER